jgi:hypothetical protein
MLNAGEEASTREVAAERVCAVSAIVCFCISFRFAVVFLKFSVWLLLYILTVVRTLTSAALKAGIIE